MSYYNKAAKWSDEIQNELNNLLPYARQQLIQKGITDSLDRAVEYVRASVHESYIYDYEFGMASTRERVDFYVGAISRDPDWIERSKLTLDSKISLMDEFVTMNSEEMNSLDQTIGRIRYELLARDYPNRTVYNIINELSFKFHNAWNNKTYPGLSIEQLMEKIYQEALPAIEELMSHVKLPMQYEDPEIRGTLLPPNQRQEIYRTHSYDSKDNLKDEIVKVLTDGLISNTQMINDEHELINPEEKRRYMQKMLDFAIRMDEMGASRRTKRDVLKLIRNIYESEKIAGITRMRNLEGHLESIWRENISMIEELIRSRSY